MCCLVLALPSVAGAAPGDPDLTFGIGGEAVLAVGTGESTLSGLAVAPDGSIIAVARHAIINVGGGEVLARFTPDGQLDRGFGTGGLVAQSRVRMAGQPLVQSDGKVLVPGWVTGPSDTFRFAVARFDTDGSFDRRFGNGGVTVVPFTSRNSLASSLARDSAGRIVAAGSAEGPNGRDQFALARLGKDGALDGSFADGGMTVSPVAKLTSAASAVDIDSSDRPVLAGSGRDVDNNGFNEPQFPVVARYTVAGALDGSFGSRGVVRPAFRGDIAYASDVLVRAGGGVIVTGAVTGWFAGSPDAPPPSPGVPLFGLKRDGRPDPSFGSGGDATVRRAGVTEGYVLAAHPDGRLLISAGYTGAPGASDLAAGGWALIRVDSDGALDPSFGARGVATTTAGPGYDFPFGLARQPGRGIVVGGTSTDCQRHVMSMVRFADSAGEAPVAAPTMRGCDPIASTTGDAISVPIDCPIVVPVCQGDVTITVPRGRRAVHVGSAHFRLTASRRSRVLSIRTGRRARRLVAGHRRLRARATFRVSGAHGRPRLTVRRVVIRH